jgi:glycosyltransferase involved in cell wall biosynthesis
MAARLDHLDKPRYYAPDPAPGIALDGKRAPMVTYSSFPDDPRPRRAVDALLKEGMSVDLICLADGKSAMRESSERLDVVRLPIHRRRGGKLSYAYEYSAFLLASAALFAFRCLKRRYDLVYVHNMPDVLVFSSLVPKALGAKVILDLHDPMPELMATIYNKDQESRSVRLMRRLEKWSIAYADAVITVNTACRRVFSSRSCRAEKIVVVMNSPDEEIFPLRRPHRGLPANPDVNKPFVIMYHGSLVERNGLDLAVAALARVKEHVPGAQLRVYGKSTPFLEQVLESARRNGLQDRVHYLGPKRLEDLVPEIEACDVGVIPNQRNPFTDINTPTRLFEYLMLGKPVIAPRTQGIRDYFGADALLYFKSGDFEDLAERLVYVATNPGEALEIVARGQQIYLTHTWREERRNLIDLVSRLVTT